MEKIDKLYPSLNDTGVDYRLTEISRLKEQLNSEYVIREAVYKKYRRAINTLENIDNGSTVTAIILGGVSTGLLSSLIGAPAFL